ncbi:MAG: hypothetical protein LBI29_02285 [Rickettsiales bacterium]|jgi:hypothetical protein|nr:hypothetical protein [Rickettsiales bacterium]
MIAIDPLAWFFELLCSFGILGYSYELSYTGHGSVHPSPQAKAERELVLVECRNINRFNILVQDLYFEDNVRNATKDEYMAILRERFKYITENMFSTG